MFASPTSLRTFRLPNRLSSVVEVADRFYVKPLLRRSASRRPAFVLALAAGSVRLVEVDSRRAAVHRSVPDLPADAASAAGKASIADRSPSARLQGSEGQKVRLRQFARKVDQALRGGLTGLELPLILAATEPLASIYRSLNSYRTSSSRASPATRRQRATTTWPQRRGRSSTRCTRTSCGDPRPLRAALLPRPRVGRRGHRGAHDDVVQILLRFGEVALGGLEIGPCVVHVLLRHGVLLHQRLEPVQSALGVLITRQRTPIRRLGADSVEAV